MRRTRRDMDAQRAALSEAQAALKQAEKALPETEMRMKEAESRGGEIHALLAQAKQMEDCLPVLGEVERLKAALDTQKRELQRLTADSSRAQAAYTAAQNSYYLSQAGLLARELKAGQPCPRVRLDRAPARRRSRRRLSPGRRWSRPQSGAETAEKGAKATRRRGWRRTEPRWTSREDRLRALKIGADETRQRLAARIDAAHQAAADRQRAIDAARSAYQALDKRKTAAQSAVDAAQKQLTALEKKTCGRKRKRLNRSGRRTGLRMKRATGLPNGRTRKSSGWIGKSGIMTSRSARSPRRPTSWRRS